MEFSKEELMLINEALIKGMNQSETEGFETEKRILDSYTSQKENVNYLIQEMYRQLLRKIEYATNDMKVK
jgi:hypothetical protein